MFNNINKYQNPVKRYPDNFKNKRKILQEIYNPISYILMVKRCSFINL